MGSGKNSLRGAGAATFVAGFLALTSNAAADIGVGGANVGIGGIEINVPGLNVPTPGLGVDVPPLNVQVGQEGSDSGGESTTVPSTETEDPTTSEPPASDPVDPPVNNDPPSSGDDPGADTGTGTGTGTGTETGTSSGSSSDGGNGSSSGGPQGGAGSGQGPTADSNADEGAGATPAPPQQGRGDGNGSGSADGSKDDGGSETLSTRAGELIAEIPSGILVALALMTVLGLLMTGRSAWFSRATKNLRLQRAALQEDVGVLASALVPTLADDIGGTAIAVAYAPAGGPASGGDFHDVFELDDGRIGMVIGDISGHGREAIPKTGIVRFTLRAYLEAGYEPRMAIRMADHALGGSFDGDFATAVAATWDPATRRLVYSSAGHPKPIVIGGSPPDEVDVLGAPPIGIGHLSGTRQTTLALSSGSEVWLISDGLTEAREPGGAVLGRGDLRRRLRRHPDPQALLESMPGYEAPSRDDMTAVRIRPEDAAGHFEPFSVETLLIEPTHDEAAVSDFLRACGLSGDDLDQCRERVASERRHEGQVLVRVSRLDEALHWRVERVDPKIAATSNFPAVPAPN